jgi:hypothetical protein
MDDRSAEESPLPLRDRMPEYLAVFGIGLGASALIGLVIGLISSAAVISAVGYAIILYGIVFLLAGGASGGGYTNIGIGAVTSMFQGRRTDEEDIDMGEAMGRTRRMSPEERLRRGLRPEANPRAFWQVVGGIAYVAVGLLIVIAAG